MSETSVPGPEEAEGPAEQLPDDAVVVRGGLMIRQDIVAAAKRYADRYDGPYGLSVWCWPGLTAGEIALRVKQMHQPGRNPLAYGKLRASTVGKIQEDRPGGRAFRLVKTGAADGHYTVTFPPDPVETDWEKVEQMFGPPEPNPAAD